MKKTTGYLFTRKTDGPYYLQYNVAGKRKIKCLKVTTQEEAEKERDKLLGAALTAKTKEEVLFHVAEARKVITRVKVPIANAWKIYLASHSRPKSGVGTLTNYKQHWGRFLEWMTANKPMVDNLFSVDRKNALEYAGFLENSHLSAGTFNHHVKTLRLVFRVLAFDNEHTGNPFEFVKLKPKAPINRKAFSRDEVTNVLGVFENPEINIPNKQYYQVLFHLGAWTGLRLGDACTIKWESIDLDAGLITLTPRKTKRVGRAVKVPIHPTLREQLETAVAWKNDTGYVLPTLAATYLSHKRTIICNVMEIIKKAKIATHGKADGRKIQPILKGFHSFRHFFASYAASVGIPVNVLAELLGDSIQTLQRFYVHSTEEAMCRAVESLTATKALPTTDRTDADRVKEALAFLNAHARITKADREKLIEIISNT